MVQPQMAYFDQKNVLVLGGAGFIGSHLVEALLEQGAVVNVLDDLSSGRRENLNLEHPDLRFQRLDITGLGQETRSSALDLAVASTDFVVHLASPIGLRLAHTHGFDTTARILSGGMNVVSACLRHRRPILYTSSSEIYGAVAHKALDEADTAGFGLEPRWGYGAAKMAVEHLVAGLYREYGIPATSARLFNVVGPRQNSQSGLVLSAFAEAAMGDEELTVHGDGTDRRTFLHVRDCAAALLAIAGCEDLLGKSVNVGGTENISILELAALVTHLSGKGRITHKSYREVYGENFAAVADRRPKLDLLIEATGWKPRRSLKDAVWDCLEDLRREKLT